jgi:hypothetical protein
MERVSDDTDRYKCFWALWEENTYPYVEEDKSVLIKDVDSETTLTLNTTHNSYSVTYGQELTVSDADAIDGLVVHNPCEIILLYPWT